MAERSVVVVLTNNTEFLLQLDTNDIGLQEGEWTNYPPPAILPGETGSWETDSGRFATGVGGFLRYHIQDNQNNWVRIQWEDPTKDVTVFQTTSATETSTPSYRHQIFPEITLR